MPDSDLEGDIEKVIRVDIGNELYVYLISLEDIIIDRLRAAIHWRSEEDAFWGFKLLATNFNFVDIPYIKSKFQAREKKKEFLKWLEQIKRSEERRVGTERKSQIGRDD